MTCDSRNKWNTKECQVDADKTAITPCSTLIGRQKFYLGYKSIGLQQYVGFDMVRGGVRDSRYLPR